MAAPDDEPGPQPPCAHSRAAADAKGSAEAGSRGRRSRGHCAFRAPGRRSPRNSRSPCVYDQASAGAERSAARPSSRSGPRRAPGRSKTRNATEAVARTSPTGAAEERAALLPARERVSILTALCQRRSPVDSDGREIRWCGGRRAIEDAPQDQKEEEAREHEGRASERGEVFRPVLSSDEERNDGSISSGSPCKSARGYASRDAEWPGTLSARRYAAT